MSDKLPQSDDQTFDEVSATDDSSADTPADASGTPSRGYIRPDQANPEHMDVASNPRKREKHEQIISSILEEFEKIDEVAGETGDRFEREIGKQEILAGEGLYGDADSAPQDQIDAPESAEEQELPAWKADATRRYEAQQAHRQAMIEERRRLDEARRKEREQHESRLKADRERFEAQRKQERDAREARLKAEREAADVRRRAEQEAKRKSREQADTRLRKNPTDRDRQEDARTRLAKDPEEGREE